MHDPADELGIAVPPPDDEPEPESCEEIDATPEPPLALSLADFEVRVLASTFRLKALTAAQVGYLLGVRLQVRVGRELVPRELTHMELLYEGLRFALKAVERVTRPSGEPLALSFETVDIGGTQTERLTKSCFQELLHGLGPGIVDVITKELAAYSFSTASQKKS